MRKTKKGISLILAIFMLLALSMTASAAPTMNSDGYYQLSTADDMLWFRDQVAAGNLTINVKLTNNIDLTDGSWTPVCGAVDPMLAHNDPANVEQYYAGTFDGDGKKITLYMTNENLFVFDRSLSSAGVPRHVGGIFLGIQETGVVKNLTIGGWADFVGTASPADIQFTFGMLATMNYGTIYNCHIDRVSFGMTQAIYDSVVGALVSVNRGEAAVIDGCTVKNATITSVSEAGTLGLIAGQNQNGAVIKNCTVQASRATLLNGGGVANGIAFIRLGEGGRIENCSVDNVSLAATLVGGIAYIASSTNSTIANCTVTNSQLDGVGTSNYVGGIVSSIVTSSGVQILNCVVSGTALSSDSSRGVANVGGIVGTIDGNEATTVAIKACLSDSNMLFAQDTTAEPYSGSYTDLAVGGIVGYLNHVNGVSPQRIVEECVVHNTDINVLSRSTLTPARIYAGMLAGYVGYNANASGFATLVQNCAVTGDENAVTVDTSGNTAGTSVAYVGGLTGYSYGQLHDNVIMQDIQYSQTGNGSTNWRVGLLTGLIGGLDNAARQGELVNNLYPDTLDFVAVLYGYVASSPNNKIYVSEHADAPFDSTITDMTLIPTVFVSFLKSGELELTAGQTLDLELEAFAGTAGIDLSAASWSSSDPSVVSVSPATGANVTISALEAGTATITCTFTLNGVETTQSVTITVPATPSYAGVEAEITGTPSDGTIYPGEEVNLTYDFSPYTAIPEIDNMGMDGSGLLAAIVDGKVVLTGTASQNSGTYSYVVKLQGTDGSIITQTVSVVIQSGSRPTGGGGGSSNCNSGVGAAVFALLGLAFVYKRK